MIGNHLRITARQLLRQKRYTLIHILGFTLALTSVWTLSRFVSFHLDFNATPTKNLYRVVTQLHLSESNVEYDPGGPLAIGPAVVEKSTEVADYSALLERWSFTVAVTDEDGGFTSRFLEEETIAMVTPNWFSVMPAQWISGQADRALTDPMTAVLTRRSALRYFGTEAALGQTLWLENEHPVTITGIIEDLPEQTDFRGDIFLSLGSVSTLVPDIKNKLWQDWGFISSRTHLILQLTDNSDPATVEGTIASMQQPHFGDYSDVYQFDLQPLADVHFDPRYGGTITRAWLWIVVGISALLLLIVGINGGNLFTAQVRMRSQAVGVRRVLGATRRSLAAQLVWEVGLLVLVSMILAGYLTLEVIPYFLMEARFLQVPMPGVLWVIMVFAAVLLLLGCVGSPLVILGRLRPSTALRKRTTALGDSRKGGQALVIAQQVMAQVLLVCTITMAMQVKHLKHADLGFATEGTLLLDLPDTENSLLSSFRDQALRVASITDLTYCNKPPLSLGGGGQIRYGGGEWQNFAVRTRIVDEHYLGTFELPLIAGRNLLHSDTLREFLVNERLLSKLGISKPEKALGTTLVAGDLHNAEGIIVGVVADFHNQSLQGVIEPVLFTTYGAGYQLAAIRFTGNQGSTVLPYLEEAWQKTFPEEVFSYSFLEQELAMAYEQENTTMLLVQSGAALAIILSSLGLFGLMSLMVGQHEREIGIRKVLGSSVLGVLVLLLRRYLLWALLATVVAAPMGYLSMHNYLADFAYRIDLSVWMFLACALIGLGVTLLTVGFEALKAAKVNPVELLRSDG